MTYNDLSLIFQKLSKKVTDNQKIKIKDLFIKGSSITKISENMKFSVQTISKQLKIILGDKYFQQIKKSNSKKIVKNKEQQNKGFPNQIDDKSKLISECSDFSSKNQEIAQFQEFYQIDPISGLIDVSNLGNGNFDFIYSISGQCPDTDTINLEIHEFIEASINQLSDFCEGTDSVQFTATTTIGNWSGLQNTHSQNGWFNTSNINDGIYEIYYTISGNCPDIDTTLITILPEPDISISVSQTLPCISYQMNIDNQSANLSNEDYAWYVNDSLYYPNFNEPFFLLDTGFYTISTIASNQFGCTIDTVILDSVPIYDTTALPQPSIIRSTIIENERLH